MSKFSIRTKKPTGKWGWTQHSTISIIYNKKKVGALYLLTEAGTNIHKFQISLVVLKKDIMEDNNPNCVWRWVRLKGRYETEAEACQFLNDNKEQLFESMTLWPLDI